jgi:hypothetical protein
MRALIFYHQLLSVLLEKCVHSVNFVERNGQFEIFLGQSDVVVHFECFVEVLDLAQIEQKSVHAFFVLLDEGLEHGHVRFFGVGGLVSQILEHLCDLDEMESVCCIETTKLCRHTRVRVRLGLSAGFCSISMYDLGVTIAGLMKRRKKKPPIKVQTVWSWASGYFLLERLLICLHIHRIPYGVSSIPLTIVSRK